MPKNGGERLDEVVLNRNLVTALTALAIACLLPFLALAEFNMTRDPDYRSLGFYALALIVLAFTLLGLLKSVFRRQPVARLAYTVAAFFFCFFAYDAMVSGVAAVRPIGNIWYLVAAWIACTSVVIAVAAYWGGGREFGLIFFTAVLVMALVPASRLAAFEFKLFSLGRSTTHSNEDRAALKLRPNIYFFLMDAYARADKIKTILQYDNSPFLDLLRDRGFYVVERATANYPVTWLSIASTLSMKYVQTESMPPYPSVAPLHTIMKGENATIHRLRGYGYKYVYVENGHFYYQCPGSEDYCIRGPNHPVLGQTEINLLKSTPLYPIILKLRPDLISQPVLGALTQVSDVADAIVDLPVKPPYFVYSHLLVPHPPFTRNAQCERIASDNISLKGWKELPVKAYTDYLQCANRQLTHVIDRIIAKDPDAVILIQGDHGTAFLMDWKLPLKEWTATGNAERLAPMNAIRLPKRCDDILYPTMSLVNSFVGVFACLEGRSPEFLPDISYISPDSDSKEFGHVRRVDPYKDD